MGQTGPVTVIRTVSERELRSPPALDTVVGHPENRMNDGMNGFEPAATMRAGSRSCARRSVTDRQQDGTVEGSQEGRTEWLC